MQDLESQWQLELWKNENGFCPVEDFLNDLKSRKNPEYIRLIKKLNRFRKYSLSELKKAQYLGKVINEDLWELRISINIEIRFLGIIKESQDLFIFYMVHGFHKKDQKIRKSDIEIARERIKNI